VRILERKDVDPNIANTFGQTPLSRAVRSGHVGIAKLLQDQEELAFGYEASTEPEGLFSPEIPEISSPDPSEPFSFNLSESLPPNSPEQFSFGSPELPSPDLSELYSPGLLELLSPDSQELSPPDLSNEPGPPFKRTRRS